MTAVQLQPGKLKKILTTTSSKPRYFWAPLRSVDSVTQIQYRTTCSHPFVKVLTIREIYGFHGGSTVGRWKAGRYLTSTVRQSCSVYVVVTGVRTCKWTRICSTLHSLVPRKLHVGRAQPACLTPSLNFSVSIATNLSESSMVSAVPNRATVLAQRPRTLLSLHSRP
jgi:hypothetical protein